MKKIGCLLGIIVVLSLSFSSLADYFPSAQSEEKPNQEDQNSWWSIEYIYSSLGALLTSDSLIDFGDIIPDLGPLFSPHTEQLGLDKTNF